MLAREKPSLGLRVCKGGIEMERERHIQKLIRMTEDEEKFIFEKMRSSKIKKFQHFTLMMLIQGEVNFTDYTELKMLVYEVKKIGININQLVKLAHQFSDVSPKDIDQLILTVNHLTQLVTDELSHQEQRTKQGGG